MNIWRNRSPRPDAPPDASATLAMLTAVLEQFYTEYAMNREAGVSDRREAMCLALARVLPDDEYMPVMQMLSGLAQPSADGSPAQDDLRTRLIEDGEEHWQRSRQAARNRAALSPTRGRSSATRR